MLAVRPYMRRKTLEGVIDKATIALLAEAGFPVEEDEQTQPLLSPRSRLCTLERLRIPVGSL